MVDVTIPRHSLLAQEFDLKTYKRKIETIVAENTFMAELQNRIVPFIVQYDVFWTRYFYQYAPSSLG